jgi:hypothetical protein
MHIRMRACTRIHTLASAHTPMDPVLKAGIKLEHVFKKRASKKTLPKKRVLGKRPTNEPQAIADFLDDDLAGKTDDEPEPDLEAEEHFEALLDADAEQPNDPREVDGMEGEEEVGTGAQHEESESSEEEADSDSD